jgi:Nucleotidyltransferase
VTSQGRTDESDLIEELWLTLEPLRFTEFSLENLTQTIVTSREDPVVVHTPAPERYAIHKFFVHGLRPATDCEGSQRLNAGCSFGTLTPEESRGKTIHPRVNKRPRPRPELEEARQRRSSCIA